MNQRTRIKNFILYLFENASYIKSKAHNHSTSDVLKINYLSPSASAFSCE